MKTITLDASKQKAATSASAINANPEIRTIPLSSLKPAPYNPRRKSLMWAMKKQPGVFSRRPGATSSLATTSMKTNVGDRPCAVFSYAGEAMAIDEARQLLAGPYGITSPKAIAV